MIRLFKKDDGITLVELLASIALLSVVILLVGSVHIFGQTHFINQTESASQSNDIQYSLSVISRDVRRAETAVFNEEKKELTAGTNVFELRGNKLLKNESVLSDRVADFRVQTEDTDGVEITILSTGNRQNQSKEYKTMIYFRR